MADPKKPKSATPVSSGHTRMAVGAPNKKKRPTPGPRPFEMEAAKESDPGRFAAAAGAPDKTGPERRKRRRGRPGPKKRYKVRSAWWAAPVAVAMGAVLIVTGIFITAQVSGYAQFIKKKAAVDRQTFYPGVSVNGQDLSQLTMDQAQRRFAAADAKERSKYSVTLTLGDQSWNLDAGALGYGSDYRRQLQAAWSVGRYGTLDERYQVVASLQKDSWQRDFMPTVTLDKEVAMAKLRPFAESLSVAAVDAKVVSFDEVNKSFTFSDSKRGYQVDPDELYQSIVRAAQAGQKTVAINRREIVPEDTAETLAQSYGQVSSATTDASFSNDNRLTNLKVSCRKLNGMRIEPGATFSFNEALGKRTAKAGYRPAAAYENGITTNQYGGGICQVSTTLFNAVAKADLKIRERAPHSRPSSYVALGKDAAVNWPNQDFKFTNTTAYPVYLTAQLTSKKRVQIGLYGKRLLGGIKIEISSETDKVIPALKDQVTVDPKLLPGERVVVEQARKGYRATTYKHYLDEKGREVRQSVLCKSYYAPSGAIVRVGPD